MVLNKLFIPTSPLIWYGEKSNIWYSDDVSWKSCFFLFWYGIDFQIIRIRSKYAINEWLISHWMCFRLFNVFCRSLFSYLMTYVLHTTNHFPQMSYEKWLNTNYSVLIVSFYGIEWTFFVTCTPGDLLKFNQFFKYRKLKCNKYDYEWNYCMCCA